MYQAINYVQQNFSFHKAALPFNPISFYQS